MVMELYLKFSEFYFIFLINTEFDRDFLMLVCFFKKQNLESTFLWLNLRLLGPKKELIMHGQWKVVCNQ